MDSLKLLSVVGTRPNLIKIAPFCKALATHTEQLSNILLHTGQHYDDKMSGDFLRELSIPMPDVNLGVGSGSHATQTAEIMKKFEAICISEQPDWVVVVGDVNSTAACAITAKKLGVKVAHIEAGLRSFDMSMPEEINRRLTDSISDILFAPSNDAVENLRHEGVAEEQIKMVGNIMIDTLVANRESADASRPYEALGLPPNGYAFLTLHRPANVDNKETLGKIVEMLEEITRQIPIIFPMHPRTASKLDEFSFSSRLADMENLNIVEPVGYRECLALAANAHFVLTDSGGLQEETTFLGVPCLTLRPNTERPITITHGTNRLVSLENYKDSLGEILSDRWKPESDTPPPLWDGCTAKRIVDIFLKLPR